jgi:hypothetical protein
MFRTRLALTFLLAAVAMPAAAGSGFEAGQWRHETNLISADVPGVPEPLIKLFAGRGARVSCSTPAQLKDSPETLLTADNGARCDLRKFSMADGRLVFDTFCVNKRFPEGLLVSSKGTFTPTSYAIATTSTGTKNGAPVKILTTGAGKRVAGSCAKP